MPMRDAPHIDLSFRTKNNEPESKRTFACDMFSAERVLLVSNAPYNYSYRGDSNYLALHDLVRSDGESFVDGARRPHVKDIRNKMTFIPANCTVSGWTAPIERQNAFLGIYFHPDTVAKQLEDSGESRNCEPAMYFENASLLSTLSKIDALLRHQAVPDNLYAETLGLLAAIELRRLPGNDGPLRKVLPGKLSRQQMELLAEFIDARLHQALSLADLAALVGLSQFHFARLFKATTGTAPHQYVLSRRISFARELLRQARLPIAKVAAASGFNGAVQFNRAFSRIVGMTPSEYRRSL